MTDQGRSRVVVGNAALDGDGPTRGWFVGHFIPSDSERHTTAVEVKWGIHPAGTARPRMAMGTESTTLSILVRGTFRVTFGDGEVRLARPGDYVLFPPSVPHGWTADEDSVVVTVRWPSKPGDAVETVHATSPTPEATVPAADEMT